jgi:hypothetical protein
VRRKRKELTCGPLLAEREKERGGALLALGGASTRPRRGGERGEASARGPGRLSAREKREGENGPARGRAGPRGEREQAGLPGLGSEFALLFPSLFLFYSF